MCKDIVIMGKKFGIMGKEKLRHIGILVIRVKLVGILKVSLYFRQEGINTDTTAAVSVVSDEEIQNLVAMGFDKTQVEVAIAAADGDLNVAVEILMTQQG